MCILVWYQIVSYPNSDNLYQIWVVLYQNHRSIRTSPNMHLFKIPHTQVCEQMLIAYDNSVESRELEIDKILLYTFDLLSRNN